MRRTHLNARSVASFHSLLHIAGGLAEPLGNRPCPKLGDKRPFAAGTAVGRHCSIAIAERFTRSMKTECVRQILMPRHMKEMREELSLYITWYNKHLPHQALDDRTPFEVCCNSQPSLTASAKTPNSKLPLVSAPQGGAGTNATLGP